MGHLDQGQAAPRAAALGPPPVRGSLKWSWVAYFRFGSRILSGLLAFSSYSLQPLTSCLIFTASHSDEDTHTSLLSLALFSRTQVSSQDNRQNPLSLQIGSFRICEHLEGINLMLTLVLTIKRGIARQSNVINVAPRAAIGSVREPGIVGQLALLAGGLMSV